MRQIILALIFFSGITASSLSNAVIILESAYQKYGFKKAEALAYQPPFQSLIFVSESASGVWIGNYNGHGYVLSAAHVFDDSSSPDDYVFHTLNGKKYLADKIILHPKWNGSEDDRTGYDFALVRLTKEVDDAGPQPALYAGRNEAGKMLTFLGYGYRGAGTKGQDTDIDTHNKPAGAVGLIEKVVDAVEPVPETGDAGDYFGIWLPKEDGSIANPISQHGITKPVSELSGILGSGDSGGPAWIETENGWVIAGINSNGDGHAKYGEASWFGRVSYIQQWIKSIVPNAKFVK